MKNAMNLRSRFVDLPKSVNWYPGHMRKAVRNLEDELKKVDMFIEVRDSWIPITSSNADLILKIPSSIKRLILFNKIDLANEKKTLSIIKDI